MQRRVQLSYLNRVTGISHRVILGQNMATQINKRSCVDEGKEKNTTGPCEKTWIGKAVPKSSTSHKKPEENEENIPHWQNRLGKETLAKRT